MTNILKYSGLVILSLWLIISTFFSYTYLKFGWEEVKYSTWNSLIGDDYLKRPTINQQLSIDIKEVEPVLYHRIKAIAQGDVLEEIRIVSASNIGIPHGSYAYLQDSFQVLFENWPKVLKEFSNDHIYGIYIVAGLRSSGRIYQVHDSDKFVIIINESVLSKDPNVWMTETEESGIKYSSVNEEFEVIIESSCSPVLTLENILIHELGHAFGVAHKLTTSFDHKLESCTSLPFYDKSYSKSIEFEPLSRYADHFNALVYYGDEESKILFSDYQELVVDLEKTSFPTMYASKNEMEFFAEIFYSYVHCEIQNKPFKYLLTDSNGKTTEVGNGIYDERCAYERAIIAAYFEESYAND
ncbi:MAG: hypothetical protein OCD76_06260 [Reichenbachiella sp.]